MVILRERKLPIVSCIYINWGVKSLFLRTMSRVAMIEVTIHGGFLQVSVGISTSDGIAGGMPPQTRQRSAELTANFD